MKFNCDSCFKDISHSVLIQCAECPNGVDFCVDCFGNRVEPGQHKAGHSYRVLRPFDFELFKMESVDGEDNWRADEELLLIEGCELNGLGNWKEISEHVGRSLKECSNHYHQLYLNEGGVDFKDHKDIPIRLPTIEAAINFGKQKKLKKTLSGSSLSSSTIIDDTLNGPTVFHSVPANHEIVGFMPLRQEFETEIENDAEISLKDLQFTENDSNFDISNKYNVCL
jgi:transcriptional adapter 2-alpha